MKALVEASAHAVVKWVENHDYKAYDPFDGLCSYLRPLTFGNLLAERVLEQIVRQSPVNLRPILGIKPEISTKGVGYMAWGYLNMFKTSRKDVYREKACHWLAWLDRNRAPGHEHHSWGNHFDHASRSGRQLRGEPDIVWTGLIGHAYLDAYELFTDERHLEIIRSIGKWILGLTRERTSTGACLSYGAWGNISIHNSNMVGAGYLARSASFTGDELAARVAKDAVEYTCSRQRPDGSWPYGESQALQWIDNFHTAYILDSLKYYINATGESRFQDNLENGFEYWRNCFFESTGRPKYYHDRTYPVDSQCAAQAIDSLANFSDTHEGALDLAGRVASWTINNMQDNDGHFYYRQYPLGIKAKMPMLHWAQATTYKALTSLLLRMNTQNNT